MSHYHLVVRASRTNLFIYVLSGKIIHVRTEFNLVWTSGQVPKIIYILIVPAVKIIVSMVSKP